MNWAKDRTPELCCLDRQDFHQANAVYSHREARYNRYHGAIPVNRTYPAIRELQLLKEKRSTYIYHCCIVEIIRGAYIARGLKLFQYQDFHCHTAQDLRYFKGKDLYKLSIEGNRPETSWLLSLGASIRPHTLQSNRAIRRGLLTQ